MSHRIEAHVKADIQLDLGQDHQYMIWNNPTGTGRALTYPHQVVKYGKIGSPDLIGTVALTIQPHHVGMTFGIALGIETKHPRKGELREQQINFQHAWEKRNGIYIKTRTPETVRDEIRERLHL